MYKVSREILDNITTLHTICIHTVLVPVISPSPGEASLIMSIYYTFTLVLVEN